ncbi:MAG TPA: sensor histidine kinase, partial [Chroococcidiopsis sp.]
RSFCGDPRLWFDEKLLRQILGNLLSNAVKYSPPQSRIEFYLDYNLERGALFQIQDQGVGIPDEDQSKLFEFFQRASNVGTTTGTGLGLAIAKHCTELHGGTITFSSHVNVGTTFVVQLPLRLAASPLEQL